MPPLENPRHEVFAQEVAKGKSAAQAYLIAGYKTDQRGAEASGPRLLGDVRVANRVLELQKVAAVKSGVTLQWLLDQAQGIIEDARAAADFSAASQTLERAAKIAGLWVDRSQAEQTVRDVSNEPMSEDEWQRRHAPQQSVMN